VSAAVLLGGMLYLALDWGRSGSVARMLLTK
jgi:hypothetical protein